MKFPILLFLILGCLCFITFGWSQSARIQQLETIVTKQRGIEFIKNNIQLSEWYLQEGYIDKAIEKAADASKMARRKNEKRWFATALNREAKALIQLKNPEAYTVATKRLQKSIQSLDAKSQADLQKENLFLLRQIARGRFTKPIDKKIPSRTTLEEREAQLFKNRQNKLKNANNQVASLETEKILLTTEQEKLKALVKKKEQELEEMNEEQAKTELLLLKNQNTVDSLLYTSIIDSIQLARNEMELREQERELAYNHSQRNFWIAIAFGGLMLAVAAFYRFIGVKRYNKILKEKNNLIATEQKRSEELLLNILPPSIAEELKENGVAKAQYFPQATVLFTDFKNFTAIAEKLSPQQLVAELNYCFKKFDQIIGDFGLEKIKTIGDAYMCVGGLPEKSTGHAAKAVQAAQAIQVFLEKWKVEKLKKGDVFFEARIGIHTGALVAGVVGEKKFAYDVWGDTVNIASRMESSGKVGKINVSKATYELIKNDFDCTYRGKIVAKNKGEIDMYFVA